MVGVGLLHRLSFISIIIGDQLIQRALPNLGASVNLLRFTVNEKLELGELRPTKISLQVDRSTRLPQAVVEGLLINEEAFIF